MSPAIMEAMDQIAGRGCNVAVSIYYAQGRWACNIVDLSGGVTNSLVHQQATHEAAFRQAYQKHVDKMQVKRPGFRRLNP